MADQDEGNLPEPAASEGAVIEAMIDRQVDGIVFVGTVSAETVVDALASRLPLVALGFHAPTRQKFDTVNTDDELGASLAVRHLFANGFLATTMFSLDRRGPRSSPNESWDTVER